VEVTWYGKGGTEEGGEGGEMMRSKRNEDKSTTSKLINNSKE